jgi:hypothetical protein
MSLPEAQKPSLLYDGFHSMANPAENKAGQFVWIRVFDASGTPTRCRIKARQQIGLGLFCKVLIRIRIN